MPYKETEKRLEPCKGRQLLAGGELGIAGDMASERTEAGRSKDVRQCHCERTNKAMVRYDANLSSFARKRFVGFILAEQGAVFRPHRGLSSTRAVVGAERVGRL
ncbi:MAG: hypothetical protein ACLP9L_07695 [Thermoguttaceae bacterium]